LEIISIPSQLHCALFLKKFKELIQRGHFIVSSSPKNRSSLVSLGITREIRKEILLSLTVDDCFSGPEPDHNFPGDIWKFGKDDEGRQIYIKLKIHDQGHRKVAKCLSFHIAEYEICYPQKPPK
jgi:hypothetical protein